MLITQKLLKQKTIKNVVFVMLLLQLCITLGQKRIIVIDPGHGGKDAGAIGINGLTEKNVVLNIAKEIIKLNKTILNSEFDIYLTRYKDTLISLTDRTRLAKTLEPDAFISIHCNHSTNTNAKGIEVYVHNSNKRNTKPSIELGSYVYSEVTEQLGFIKRGVKFANFQVLRESNNHPTILVELGFMTNTDEADYFLKNKNIKAIALAIILGTMKYLKPMQS